jgi:adenosylhomocysteine nucleosidase
MRILMVASDRMEFAAFRGAMAGPAAPEVDWSRRVQFGGNEFLLVANGAGSKRASAAVNAALADYPAEAVVSTGFCGALDSKLALAEIVTATDVTDGARRFRALPPDCLRPHRQGVVASIDHVAQTAKEKAALHAGGAIAVEMEAAGVAACAETHGLPFSCVKVITDLAGEDMANDFNAALREDGHFATMNLLAGTLQKPLVRLPELLRLRNRCSRAARVLGEFIADCRF